MQYFPRRGKTFGSMCAALLLLLAPVASADVAPPNIGGCSSKKAGDTCKTDRNVGGVCTTSRCSKLDYSQGIPPSSINYDCLLCQEGAAEPPVKTTPVETAPVTTEKVKSSTKCTYTGLGPAHGGTGVILTSLLLLGLIGRLRQHA
jgi:hypothetical protein